jgi:anti-anti-sigma factor
MPQATACPLTVEVELTASAALVKCHGKLIAGVGDVLYVPVNSLFANHKRVVIDLTDLTRMDSLGLGTLVRLYVSARSAGCCVELINVGKQIRDLLGITNMLKVFADTGENGIKMC